MLQIFHLPRSFLLPALEKQWEKRSRWKGRKYGNRSTDWSCSWISEYIPSLTALPPQHFLAGGARRRKEQPREELCSEIGILSLCILVGFVPDRAVPPPLLFSPFEILASPFPQNRFICDLIWTICFCLKCWQFQHVSRENSLLRFSNSMSERKVHWRMHQVRIRFEGKTTSRPSGKSLFPPCLLSSWAFHPTLSCSR